MFHRKLACFSAAAFALTAGASAYAFDLPDPTYNAYQYGDFYSYSLPILAYKYDLENGGGVGPGNPYYVASSSGQIKDLPVIGTGTSSTPATTNVAGMDDAYPTPSGVATGTTAMFQTTTSNPGGVADPGGANEFTGDTENTWDSRVSAMTDFLGAGNDLVFFFNNNQVNSGSAEDQNLMAWAQVILRSDDGTQVAYFDFTNNGGAGGTPGGDVTSYASSGATPGANDAPTTITTTDPYYVKSGGQVTLSGVETCIGLDGTYVAGCTPTTQTFNHNLGANQAAYALWSPELNAALRSGLYDVIQVDIRMSMLNNGYEQIFVGAVTTPGTTQVAEPGMLALFGLTLPWLMRRRVRA